MTALTLATRIVSRLVEAGYVAYFAGGWVRDLVLKCAALSPEIDIATSAPPEKIIELFDKTIPVGIAFGVVIVVLEEMQFEVTTFRKDRPYHDGRHPEGIDLSDPKHDALRRDFTINGMFYNPLTEELIDYVRGQEDLAAKVIRAIGNPDERFTEDRLRMIRAVRFATRFGFTVDQQTQEAICRHAGTLLPSVSMERILQELSKMAQDGTMREATLLLHQLGLFQQLFPSLHALSRREFEALTAPFPYFPPTTPAILYIALLFATAPLSEKIALCRKLKTSVRDIELVRFFEESRMLFQKPHPAHLWAHFYAHKDASLMLDLNAALLPMEQRQRFLAHHESEQRRLKAHIDRLIAKRPLVTAALLEKEGIAAGQKMGALLKAAEVLAIDEDLIDPSELIERLKNTALWKS